MFKTSIKKCLRSLNSAKLNEPVEAGVSPREVVDAAPLQDREALRTVAA